MTRPWPRTAEERRIMAPTEEPPWGLPEEAPVGRMPEKLTTVRDALQTMVRRSQKGGAVT